MSSLASHLKGGKQLLGKLPLITQLSARVWRFLGSNPGSYSLQGTNTYLVGTGSSRILIDTGEGKRDYLTTLKEGMRQAGCTSISQIVVSHWHHDHLGGVSSVLEDHGSNIPVLKYMPEELEASFGGEGTITPYEMWPKDKFTPVVDGEILTTAGATLKVLFTPGHANDHICLVLEEENSMFTADNVLGTGTSVFRNLHSYMNSLQRMKSFNPEKLYPGHGPVVEEGTSKIIEYISHRRQRIRGAVAVLETPPKDGETYWSLESLTRQIYQGLPENLVFPAMGNMYLVLEALSKDGIVHRVPHTSNDGSHKKVDPDSRWHLAVSSGQAFSIAENSASKL